MKLVQAFANSVEKTVLGEIMSIVARTLSSFRGNRAGSWCFARPGGGWPDRVLNLKSRHPPEMGTFTAPYVKVSQRLVSFSAARQCGMRDSGPGLR